MNVYHHLMGLKRHSQHLKFYISYYNMCPTDIKQFKYYNPTKSSSEPISKLNLRLNT